MTGPSIAIDPATEADWPAIQHIDELAFGYAWSGDGIRDPGRAVLELDRTLVARQGGQPIAMASAYSYRLSVPGGALPTAGVTWVGVVPTHRRQGALRALMRRQLDDVRAAGSEPLAALWASEPAVYGRFGYGLASRCLSLSVPSGAALVGPVDPSLRVRLTTPAEGRNGIDRVYAAVARRRPGLPDSNDALFAHRMLDRPDERAGRSPLRLALVEDDSGARAYAAFRTKPDWSDGLADGSVLVRELLAMDPAAAAAVWRLLTGIDLMARVVVDNVPEDDPLLLLLADPRRPRPVLRDALYVRLVDLPVALAGRRYSAETDVVLDVTDDFAPWNSGRWRLAGGPGGATCERTGAPADVSLDSSTLAATYLGGTSLARLAAAGLVGEHTPGAVHTAALALRHEPAPYCPFVF